MKKKKNTRWLLAAAVAVAASIGFSSCAGMFGSFGIGPGGPDFEISGPIGGGLDGPGGPPPPPPPPPGGPGGPGGPW